MKRRSFLQILAGLFTAPVVAKLPETPAEALDGLTEADIERSMREIFSGGGTPDMDLVDEDVFDMIHRIPMTEPSPMHDLPVRTFETEFGQLHTIEPREWK